MVTGCRFALACLLALSCVSGCQLLHELQPHRLQRLNRGPEIGSGALYSVPDPVGSPLDDADPSSRMPRAVDSDE
jgi:hypothetical protein